MTALPRMTPLVLKRRPHAFDNPDWLFELKYDGFRALLEIDGASARPVSRNRNRFKIASGMVASVNRPGANVTGINLLSDELRTKRLEVLRDLVPAAKVVGLLVNQANRLRSDAGAAPAAAQGMGLQLTVLEASSESEIDRAFASLAERHADALLVDGDAFFQSRRGQLVALAARQPIPAIFDTRDFTEIGGLISYGPDYSVAYREAGVYAGRILRGAKPGDLPVAQLSKVELIINAKTAKALGLTIPPAILTRADEVIE